MALKLFNLPHTSWRNTELVFTEPLTVMNTRSRKAMYLWGLGAAGA
jgi:hypothetical protein